MTSVWEARPGNADDLPEEARPYAEMLAEDEHLYLGLLRRRHEHWVAYHDDMPYNETLEGGAAARYFLNRNSACLELHVVLPGAVGKKEYSATVIGGLAITSDPEPRAQAGGYGHGRCTCAGNGREGCEVHRGDRARCICGSGFGMNLSCPIHKPKHRRTLEGGPS